MHRLGRLRLGPLTAVVIRLYVRAFRIDLREALEPDPRAYPSFNAFFTRALAPGARPLPADDRHAPPLLSPVDGTLSQGGPIDGRRLFQAKDRGFDLDALLGGDPGLAARFHGGLFATLYLSPRDYHRIHMPTAGRLRLMRHVPGRLFSVNPTTVAGVANLFARNERVVCLFDTAVGPLAVILVGAIFVGSIETVWAGTVTPNRRGRPSDTRYDETELPLARGAELGRFNLGSTVILLLPRGAATLSPTLRAGAAVRCRGAIGRLHPAGSRRDDPAVPAARGAIAVPGR
jgi:phosphatidylserine decarboxylase